MSETTQQKLARLEEMSGDDGQTWDLSPKDQDAIRWVLANRVTLLREKEHLLAKMAAFESDGYAET